ncbi:hypothetical protein M5X00_13220 [Paenibacillus alvei]|nr:hypothetical protein [Paenibacillus alvei]MCY9540516.1 hypothetical protein [Paenibacillus alvei]MCY9708280.1 hypothetical protein [Paenibacillus alvei]MCY9732925.1 hypothetical protein [Paenibacillus alvei]MCY9755201.1 hypothetical protein [Paenibacillus alvei]MEC0080321.1 hypothetical protein [Paenibacillus alvei]
MENQLPSLCTKKIYKLLASFFTLAFVLVFFTTSTTYAANSDNFKIKFTGSGYAKDSEGETFVHTFTKSAKEVKFGIVLDSVDTNSQNFPITLKVQLQEEWGNTEFSKKSITFTKTGKTEYSGTYSGTIDPGNYIVHIEIKDGGFTKIKGNGFIYYKY